MLSFRFQNRCELPMYVFTKRLNNYIAVLWTSQNKSCEIIIHCNYVHFLGVLFMIFPIKDLNVSDKFSDN